MVLIPSWSHRCVAIYDMNHVSSRNGTAVCSLKLSSPLDHAGHVMHNTKAATSLLIRPYNLMAVMALAKREGIGYWVI